MPTPTYDRTVELLTEMDIAPEEIHAEAELRADLDIDSTELVEIVASLTAGAGCQVDGKALKGVRTVTELATYIDEAIQSRAAA